MKFDTRKDINPKYLLLALTIVCVILIIASYFAGSSITKVKLITGKVIEPVQAGINKIGIWTDSKLENLREIEELNKENEKLKEEIGKYREELTAYQGRMNELSELRKLYKLDESYPELNKTAAHIFAKDSSSWFSSFYIDKGTDDGLFTGANVMCYDGLCGLIVECYPNYSRVRSIIDDESKISAKILPSNALCTVEGNLAQFQDGHMIVKNIDKDAAISVGDKVVTSHISTRFHQGITIGYVANIEPDTNNLTVTAYITPAVEFGNIEDVLVVTDKKLEVD